MHVVFSESDLILSLAYYRVFIKYCVFFENAKYFATSPSPALGCYWLYRKWPANKSDCTLRSQIRSVAPLLAGDGMQSIWMITL